MHKLAVFVEGHTESLFIEKFISEIARKNSVAIEQRKIRGGTSVPRTMAVIKAAAEITHEQFYVLILDCGGDKAVASRIREEHENLTNNGYSKIIGMRDVRPDYSHAEPARLEAGIKKYIKTKLIPVEFVLATMEIEAWFLAEYNHFQKVDEALTIEAIRVALQFDPVDGDTTLRENPTEDMDKCYQIVGKSYSKRDANIVNNLDYEFIYCELAKKIKYLSQLKESLDSFLTPAAA